MRIIEIGDTSLSTITEDHLKQIIILEGCCNFLEYWHEPVIIEMDTSMRSNSITAEYHSMRKEDNRQGDNLTFFLNTDYFTFHYVRNLYSKPMGRSSNGKRLSIASLSFLIKQGYQIPL